ncbi:aquaporin [Demequina lutea]|uniref:Aquaporin Z n=1 Tax=Demequina lutea TaxID=431489 RepID=A0A7Y9ZAL3_9MICO|nr:aquaporin [Demequina lutea]NYI40718.1 aquaporin Z [Demequina lutea]
MADAPIETETVELEADLETRTVVTEPSGPSLLARVGAEAAGTFIMVLLGAGTALLLKVTGNPPIVVGLGFGLGAMIAIIAFGHISGAHVNPAVTVGSWIAGRLSGLDVVPYVLAQVVGGILAGLFLRLGLGSLDVVDKAQAMGLMSSVSNGFGDHAPFATAGLNWGVFVALIVEMLATGLWALVVLSATAKKASPAIAPFAIGLAVAALVSFTLPFTNAALNPARATATAIFADNWALTQLWAWWLAPIVGAAIVGLAFRIFGPAEDLVAVPSARFE